MPKAQERESILASLLSPEKYQEHLSQRDSEPAVDQSVEPWMVAAESIHYFAFGSIILKLSSKTFLYFSSYNV